MAKYECADCGYKCETGIDFANHVHECKVRPVPMPKAEVERISAANEKSGLVGS